MKANVTIQVEINTVNYPGYEDSTMGVQSIAQDVLTGQVTLKEQPQIVVDAPLPPNPT